MKRYLQSRNVGLCMCHNRHLGNHVVRSTKPTIFLWPQFVVTDASRVPRSEEHLQNVRYPAPAYYLNQVLQSFFRHPDLRYLRPEQFFRYFRHGEAEEESKPLGPEDARRAGGIRRGWSHPRRAKP